MSFCQNTPGGMTLQAFFKTIFAREDITYFSNVDFPAPRNPQMMVNGTRAEEVGCIFETCLTVVEVSSPTDAASFSTRDLGINDEYRFKGLG